MGFALRLGNSVTVICFGRYFGRYFSAKELMLKEPEGPFYFLYLHRHRSVWHRVCTSECGVPTLVPKKKSGMTGEVQQQTTGIYIIYLYDSV